MKNVNWDSMLAEFDHRVRLGLQPFVASRLPRYPRNEQAFTVARNRLYAYHFGAGARLSLLLDHPPFPWKKELQDLSVAGCLSIVCSMHASVEVATICRSSAEERASGWGVLMLDGICEMYGRGSRYRDDWLNKVDWIAENLLRMDGRLYDEIYPVLGLPPVGSLSDGMFWRRTAIGIAEGSLELVNRPEWSGFVDSKLAAI